jgi:uncharacterized membrane protein
VTLDAGSIGLLVSVLLASAVEFVEALTIVLAMGVARGWRATLWGTGLALVVLAAVTVALGTALDRVVSEAALQLTVGLLLLVFGLGWLRKAILRFSGHKALHDEDAIFRRQQEEARRAGREQRLGLDWYAFVISFKGVLLEGLEVVFIVLTFGTNAHDIPVAAAGAGIAAAVVLVAGLVLHRPLARVPENSLKFAVGLLLCTFGTFWVGEGVGALTAHGRSLHWPGGDAALIVLMLAWGALSWWMVRALRARIVGGVA